MISLLFLTACGLSKNNDILEPQSYSFNGVKLIRPDILEGTDVTTMLQSQYSVSNFSRLLLRFEEFLSKVDSLSLSQDRKVKVYIYLKNRFDSASVENDLVLCPVATSWMMLATWLKAFPMGTKGSWKTAGGDFELSECVNSSAIREGRLEYDVTNWVINDVKGKSRNFGLILMSKSSNLYLVYGDQSGNQSPKIEWLSLNR